MEAQQLCRAEVRDLLQLEEGLSEWEVNFVEDVNKWRREYTPAQMKTIHRIWDRRCGGAK